MVGVHHVPSMTRSSAVALDGGNNCPRVRRNYGPCSSTLSLFCLPLKKKLKIRFANISQIVCQVRRLSNYFLRSDNFQPGEADNLILLELQKFSTNRARRSGKREDRNCWSVSTPFSNVMLIISLLGGAALSYRTEELKASLVCDHVCGAAFVLI
jgi:hypothetical protein